MTDVVLRRLRDEQAPVPQIRPLEIASVVLVANVVLVAERRGRLTESQASGFLQLLEQWPIAVGDSPADISAIVTTGRRHSLSSCELSSYDAGSFTPAAQPRIPLTTLDRRLAAAAKDAGIDLLVHP